MRIQLYMISVKYDHSQAPQQDRLSIKSIHIGDKVAHKNETEWFVSNHYRQQKDDQLRQVGIRLLEPFPSLPTVLICSPDGQNPFPFTYNEEMDIWFQPTIFTTKKRKSFYIFRTDQMLTGITNAGSAKLEISVGNKLMLVATLHFIPSSLSIQDYEEIIVDLYRIREDFVRDDRNIAKVAIRTEQVLMTLQEQLKMLKQTIQQINASPHATLMLQTTKIKPTKLGRFDLRMEIEQYMNPGQPIYRSRTLQPMVATVENKLIKQMLTDLVHYATNYGSNNTLTKSQLRNVLNKREAYYKKSDFRIQRLFQDATQIEDAVSYKGAHDQITDELQPYINEERAIRENVLATADFSVTPPNDSTLVYTEVTFSQHGFTSSYHHQSIQGMDAFVKYDRREPQLAIQTYTVPTSSGYIQLKPNSHFGTVQLQSRHIPSHARFHEIFNAEAQQQSIDQRRQIKIKGYIQPVPNGIDAVSTPNPNNTSYRLYSFNFVYITSIEVNGQEIHVSTDEKKMRQFLAEELPVRMNGADRIEEAFMRLKQLEQLNAFGEEKKQISFNAQKYDELRETAQQLLQLPLFALLNVNERLPIKPTQVFLHNPSYRVAWQAIQRIQHELSASLFVKAQEQQVSTAKVEQIFEVWTLYKIMHLLTKEMGWQLEGNKNVTDCLDSFLLQGKGLKNFSTTLWFHQWQIELYYEPKINLALGNFVTPDFVLRILFEGKPVGLVVLDAKYRDYKSQGSTQWKKDIDEVAIRKYGSMQPAEPKWQLPILNSSILHSDALISDDAEETYNPYHVMYNQQLFETNLNAQTAHRYGSIYLIPSSTHVFKNWFRLIMEYHLREHKVCWNCGELKDVQQRQLLTAGGNPKYHYLCKCCNEFWVKVHCSSHGHRLIKHTLNYHLQVERNSRWFVVCPTCGDGRPDQQLKHDNSEQFFLL